MILSIVNAVFIFSGFIYKNQTDIEKHFANKKY